MKKNIITLFGIAIILVVIIAIITLSSQGFLQCVICETDWIDEESFASFTGSWSQQDLPPTQGGSLIVQNAYDEDFTTVAVTFEHQTTSMIIEDTTLTNIPPNSEIIGLEFDVKGGAGEGSGATIKYSVWNFVTSSWDEIIKLRNNGVTDRNILSVDPLNHIQNNKVRLQTETFSGNGEVWVYESRVRVLYSEKDEPPIEEMVWQIIDNKCESVILGFEEGTTFNTLQECEDALEPIKPPIPPTSNLLINLAIISGVIIAIFIIGFIIFLVRRK